MPRPFLLPAFRPVRNASVGASRKVRPAALSAKKEWWHMRVVSFGCRENGDCFLVPLHWGL